MDLGGSFHEGIPSKKANHKSSINKFIQSATDLTTVKAIEHLRDPIHMNDLAYGVSINGESMDHMI